MISPEHRAILEKTGELVRILRKEKKMSQKQIAFEMGISIAQYELIEKGRVNFGILTIYRLSEVLEVDPCTFLMNQKLSEEI